jgi:predicted 3-demethylubiquinone-9 3-methyltransferase (glyoxalase superfamily)
VHKISPFLWYNNGAEEAANLYVSIFGGSIIDKRLWGPGGAAPEGSLLSVTFEIDGRNYIAFEGGPGDAFNDSISMSVIVDTQEELDDAWSRLIEGGGQEVVCGWLRDKWGVRWQIAPAILEELMTSADPGVAERATKAMLSMIKLDIAALKAAAEG